jgi:hypothetical protein
LAIPEQTAQVGPDGQFAFDQIPADPSTPFRVSVDYAGVSYDAAVPSATGNSLTALKITVYEPSTSEDVLKIDSANWVVESIDTANQQVVVLETVDLFNTADRAYVGDHRGDPGSDTPGVLPRTLRIYLPQGSSDFRPVAGLDASGLLPVAGGYVDTQPILPGRHQIAYSYRIAYADGGMELRHALPYPTQTLRVLVPNVGLQLRTDKLKNAGNVDLQGRQYAVLTADSVQPNTDITLDALGFPTDLNGRLDPQTMQTIGLGIVGIAVVAAIALGVRPKTSKSADDGDNRREILLAIARLDAQHASGKIDHQEYDDARARQKKLLVGIASGENEAATSSENRA